MHDSMRVAAALPETTTAHPPRRPLGISVALRQLSGGEMKNPLDSLWGTVITGLVLTIVLYWIAKTVMGS
jgi:hypothetical protein